MRSLGNRSSHRADSEFRELIPAVRLLIIQQNYLDTRTGELRLQWIVQAHPNEVAHLMLYLPKMLSPEMIRPRIEAGDKWALLDKLAELLASSNPKAHGKPLDKQAIYEAVALRERERSSAIGRGCALPHARIPGLDKPVACGDSGDSAGLWRGRSRARLHRVSAPGSP